MIGDYRKIGLHFGEYLMTLRMSMGDYGSAISDSQKLQEPENIIFWIIWGLTVTVTSIIFLNFVVAEACASYTAVTETLDEVIQ